MKRPLRVMGILFLVAILLFALWASRSHSTGKPGHDSLKDTVRSAVSDPEQFAKSHFTGGVGVMLKLDPTNGVLMVDHVIAGSPAEKAGLRQGDLILQVDGVPTQGRSLTQNVESIRGFTAGSVTLTIQRPGSTNQELVIRRSSWNSLGVTNMP